MTVIDIWEKAQQEIKEKVGATSYETWFSTIHVREKDAGTLILEAPDNFFKNWIVDHYKDFIEGILKKISPQHHTIEFTVNAQILDQQAPARPAPLENRFPDAERNYHKLNSNFIFDNFVIGPSNRFACAASLAVAESPAKAYNPLLIYGGVGLGKTHLLQAITHKIKQLDPKLKTYYLSSEKFTNELIDAIRNRSAADFRKKYREIDVLLIDDIQFIAGKESTQEEFFHTFNALHDNRKQIILTSDRPPQEISNLEERLRSRFAWGLITDIQPPDFETRVAILKKKIEHEPVKVPDDVIYFIAEQIKTNIRELEGALIRVAAYSLLEEKPLSLEMARLVLRDMVKETSTTITVDMVQRAVCEHFHIPLSELRAKKRNKNIVLPRQVAMYLSRTLTNMSLPEIGNAFGGKDHTTVLHSCKKIEIEITRDEKLKSSVFRLSTGLKH